MSHHSVKENEVWKKLEQHVNELEMPENHLKNLVGSSHRISKFSRKNAGMLYDFSRQRVTDKTMRLLFDLANRLDLKKKFNNMTEGQKVNVTENRAALHTATRSFANQTILVDDHDIGAETEAVRKAIASFATQIHQHRIVSGAGKPFRHIVVIGIGGSYLGAQFVAEALAAYADKGIDIHFLANVDIDEFGKIVSIIDPETTLWIVISKSYTTPETLANVERAQEFMREKGLTPSRHIVTVTGKGSPGDDPSNPVLQTFHMFDYIGGRYSVTSAVGGVPLSLYLGYERFEAFLKGANEMDLHAAQAPVEENLPLIAALIGVWNNNFLSYETWGIIPYAAPLSKLAAHIQQLYMESNGKSVTQDGEPLDVASGVIVFGEPGTNAQHSFFQLAHQGRPFPIDFIGALKPQYPQYRGKTQDVTNYQELWANLISQPQALAIGKTDDNPAKYFPGNRPSSTLIVNDLSPENIGRLLSFYEAKTVYEAFIWNINPFDQFGVELGKTIAKGIRQEMAMKNKNSNYAFENVKDPVVRFYLGMLYEGELQ